MALAAALLVSPAPQAVRAGSTQPRSTPVVGKPAAISGGDCLGRTLCHLKEQIGTKRNRASWSPDFCDALADKMRQAAARHDLSPALVLAVAINESDLDQNAARVSRSKGRLAKDSGLMGIRCVLDGRGRCTNGLVRGLRWRDVMDPFTNVELGARYLAHYRDVGGRSQVIVRRRGSDGQVRAVARNVRCRHRDHAFWAHYNHGTRYINRGWPRHYPHRVGVLYEALASALALDASDLTAATLSRRGISQRAMTFGGGSGERYATLTTLIRSTAACPARTTVAERSDFVVTKRL